MSIELEILKAVRNRVEERKYRAFICCEISSYCRELGLQYMGPEAVGLRNDVLEFLDGASCVEAWLGILNENSPVLKQYRLAIIDVLIRRYSK